MFLKCSKAVQNKTAVQHFLSHSTRLSKRGDITAREATSSSACHWCLHHEARHPSPSKPHEKEQPPPCASAAPREPRRRLCPPHLGAGRAEGRAIHPLPDNRQRQAEFRGLAGKRQNVGILLEIRKGEKVSCVPRDSRLLVLKESLKTAHKSHAADLHCCAGICPLPLCCWLPQSHFLLPLTVSISLCLLLNLFLHLSHSQHFLPSGSRSYFCICASHTSPTTLLHTLPFSPSPHLSTGFSHSFELLASNLSYSSTTKRSEEQRKTGQDGHTTRQVR